jgi:Xaa-Pro aminopeptidase
MTVETFHRYVTALVTPMVPLGDLLAQMRAVKTEEEIGYIKKAQSIADAAYSHILKVLTPTVTEKEIALELSYFMRRNGAEGDSFDIIAVSGAASALPHGKCRNERISKGFLTMDFGCRYHGYCSDMTRTVCIGKADEEMRRVYQTVLAAQREALSVIRAGETGAFVDGIARQYITARGYGNAFSHSLGHGVGLYIHELPTLSSRSNASLLVSGNVVTVEPGIYLAGKYGCRIEDMGVVTADGFDNFTKSNKELIELFA